LGRGLTDVSSTVQDINAKIDILNKSNAAQQVNQRMEVESCLKEQLSDLAFKMASEIDQVQRFQKSFYETEIRSLKEKRNELLSTISDLKKNMEDLDAINANLKEK
jgi:FtsZ-binding cell division protein ZapB